MPEERRPLHSEKELQVFSPKLKGKLNSKGHDEIRDNTELRIPLGIKG